MPQNPYVIRGMKTKLQVPRSDRGYTITQCVFAAGNFTTALLQLRMLMLLWLGLLTVRSWGLLLPVTVNHDEGQAHEVHEHEHTLHLDEREWNRRAGLDVHCVPQPNHC